MITETHFNFENRYGDSIFATATWTTETPGASGAPLPLVLLLHGFKGFRNWGFFPLAARRLADDGMLVVRMDFSLNGMRGTDDVVVSTEDFGRNTISREVDDVEDMIGYLLKSSDSIAREIRARWDGTLQLVGHSRGGGVAMLAGAKHNAQGVVVWNSVGKWGRWSARQRNAWVDAGSIVIENARTGQKLPMDSAYVFDIERGRDSQSLITACATLSERLLFIHAEHDMTVPLKEIQTLLDESEGEASLVIVPNTTHTFGITHPFEKTSPAFEDVLNKTSAFLQTNSRVEPAVQIDLQDGNS